MSDSAFKTWEEAVDWLVDQQDQQELVRACYFDKPLRQAARRYSESEEWQAARNLLPANGGLALDVGAGMGIASYALAKDGWQVTAIEPDPSEKVGAGAIGALARDEGLPIEVLQQGAEHLPFTDRTFDLIHARQVLHHVQDLRQLCRELFRVLKPGGMLLATREHVISSASQLPRFLDEHPLHRLYGGENAYKLSQYKSAVRDAGFDLRRVIGPFDSVINYAPSTRGTLREELSKRLRRIPGGSVAAGLLLHEPLLTSALAFLSLIDSRPGRLFSFVALRPREN